MAESEDFPRAGMNARGPTIGILGMFADSNLGDDAGPTALLRHLGRRVPGATFALFCRYPEVARERFSALAYPIQRQARGQTRSWQPPPGLVESFSQGQPTTERRDWRARARAIPPLRFAVRAARATANVLRQLPGELRFLWDSYRRLRRIDLLMVAGSNPICDFYGGFWGYPYTMWKWTTLSRLARTKVAFVSVGAGPIASRRSGRLLAATLDRADYVSFRDEGSLRLMRQHGLEANASVCPDLAHGLPFTPVRREPTSRMRVGINPMIVFHGVFWPVSDRDRYRSYVEGLTALIAALDEDGHEVFLYGTQKDDVVPAEEIRDLIRTAYPGRTIPEYHPPESVEGLFRLSSSADLLVSTRFHGAVFGVMARRPTLAICYQVKTREVVDAAGLGEFAFEVEDVCMAKLRPAVARLQERRSEIWHLLDGHSERVRAQLAAQDAALAALLGVPQSAQQLQPVTVG
jgi:polysaccharide pyruvyl transferase WcaK-like protein